jgi:hypothetical protein
VPKVIQFRDQTLDLGLMNQAKQTYGDIVPSCKSHAIIKNINIYEMERIAGTAFSLARRQLFAQTMEARLFQTVEDLARSVFLVT